MVPESNFTKIQASFRHWLLKQIVLPIGDKIIGQKMIQRLKFLEQAQWWDWERLEGCRNNSLAFVLKVVYEEVPLYRNLMDKAKVRPGDILTVEDLRKLPIVTKDMLRDGYPDFTTRKTSHRAREYHTSGSTGTNFSILHDNETLGWCRSSFLLAAQWSGWKIGQRHLQTGITIKRGFVKTIKDYVLNCYYISSYDLTDSNLDDSLDCIDKNKIKYLWGYPGSLYFLAQRAIKRGWNRSLHSIMTWGDNLYPNYRKTIEKAFGARIFDTYGCVEGMQIAAQCGSVDTYHIHSLDVIVESVDDNGISVAENDSGNLIITRLHPGPMPLIRYKIGDIGVIGEQHKCLCGRGFAKLKAINGRDTDIVITPSGNRLIVHFFTGILEHYIEINSYQIVQEEIGSIILRVVPAEGFSKEIADKIIHEISDRGASDLKIIFEEVKAIPLSKVGKRQFVVSKLGRSLKN